MYAIELMERMEEMKMGGVPCVDMKREAGLTAPALKVRAAAAAAPLNRAMATIVGCGLEMRGDGWRMDGGAIGVGGWVREGLGG